MPAVKRPTLTKRTRGDGRSRTRSAIASNRSSRSATNALASSSASTARPNSWMLRRSSGNVATRPTR